MAELEQQTVSSTTTEPKKSKVRKTKYHLMLFIDSADGVKQMGIGQAFVDGLLVLIVSVIVILSVMLSKANQKVDKLTQENQKATAQIESITEELSAVKQENSSLSNKVTILSDTVNTKVEKETAIKAETEEAHRPSGFPLSTSASMSTSQENEKLLIFKASSESSVIATGAGTVTAVTSGEEEGYEHCVEVNHNNGYISRYYNNGNAMVKEGDEVITGSVLYVIGDSNTEVGYMMEENGNFIDPMSLIAIDG